MNAMEKLEFKFPSQALLAAAPPALCGVVGSGNLEILVRSGVDRQICEISVNTSARGFGETWRAVLATFAASQAVGGTSIAINDMGATPAVVSLRLAQALADYRGGAQ